jgi:ferrous iron transport protein B
VALFTGLFAKEAVVGTLNSLYSQTDAQGEVSEQTEENALTVISEGFKEAVGTIPANLADVAGGLLDPLGFSLLGEAEDTIAEETGASTSVFISMRTHFNEGAAQVYAYLLFVLLYVPCMAAMGAVIREIGGRLGFILGTYLTLLAWVTSTLVYQIGIGHNPLWISVAVLIFVTVVIILRMMGRYRRRA